MRSSDIDILLIPGLSDSGADHWQTRWEEKLSTARRVVQQDWDNPVREDWVAAIVAAARAATRPIVFVAHSLGVHALVHAAPQLADTDIRGAFLVTPPSEAKLAALPQVDPAFSPVPTEPLPFPSVLVASRSDPYASYDEASGFALAWGSALADAGDAGHVNTQSGHGPWPEGLMRFAGFLKRL